MQGRIWRRWRVVVAFSAALAPGAADAFDGFGLWPESEAPVAASPRALPYRLTFTLPEGLGVSLSTLRDASSLYALRKDPPPDGFSLALRARRDFAPLVDALWSQGYYDAQVAIRVDGVALPMGTGDFTAFQRAAETYRGKAAAPLEIVVSPGKRFALRRLAVLGGDRRPLDLPQRVIALRSGDPAAADVIRGAQAVSFDGEAMPRLDMEAQQTLSDATAIIDVTGPADKPAFTFSSNPQLPQDEILSRILFQKPSGSLSAFQALQLANTVSALSGNGGAFDSMRRSLGVDSLDVSSNASGGPVVGGRRAISNRLSLGVRIGARPEDNGVSLDLDLTRRLRLSTGVDAKGESNVGAGLQWEY